MPNHSTRVLVVEDNSLNMELVRDILECAGWFVIQARSGEEALWLAEVARPDLVLMDLSLPGMDGLTATRRLRSNPLTMHLAIIALTAHAMRGDEACALESGCDGYLTKPLNTRTFLSDITRLAREAAMGREPAIN